MNRERPSLCRRELLATVVGFTTFGAGCSGTNSEPTTESGRGDSRFGYGGNPIGSDDRTNLDEDADVPTGDSSDNGIEEINETDKNEENTPRNVDGKVYGVQEYGKYGYGGILT